MFYIRDRSGKIVGARRDFLDAQEHARTSRRAGMGSQVITAAGVLLSTVVSFAMPDAAARHIPMGNVVSLGWGS